MAQGLSRCCCFILWPAYMGGLRLRLRVIPPGAFPSEGLVDGSE